MNRRQPQQISPEEYELIDAYLQGEINDERAAEIERRINNDTDFREKVDELRHLSIGISEATLRNKLDSFHDSMMKPIAPVKTMDQHPRKLFIRWIAIAACTLIIGGTAWWMLRDGKTENQRLYSAYYSADIGLPVAMGSSDSIAYTFYDGMVSYKEDKYKDAITKWQSIAAVSGYSDTLRYYIAMALLNDEQETEAEAMLKELTGTNTSAFLDDAYWYLALIRLKKEDRPGAANYLEKIKTDRPEAGELLSKIKP